MSADESRELTAAELRFTARGADLDPIVEGLESDARSLIAEGSDRSAAAAFAFAVAALLQATTTIRQAGPAAFLAMVVGRLWHKHAAMAEDDALALLARMMAGEDRRDVMVNLATAAIDGWVAEQRSAEVPGEAMEMEIPEGPDLGEGMGGFEPPTGDEVEPEAPTPLPAEGVSA